ncbi:MAG TPA: DUF2726 domain-containing protein [Woeseiaceae bacterium]|nr:DUF2726 domain-containing protein [Woeseiaceae bacterium]
MIPKLLIAFAVLLALAVLARLVSARGKPARYPYGRKEALFTPAERSFLGVLEQAVGQHYRVFGKVRVADAIGVKSGLSSSERQSALNRIRSKHFDFLLCDREDLSIVCAIELDDKSHGRSSRRERDAFLDELCRNTGLPLLRIRASKAYPVPEIRVKILEATGRKLEPLLSPGAPPAPRTTAASRLAPTIRLHE